MESGLRFDVIQSHLNKNLVCIPGQELDPPGDETLKRKTEFNLESFG